MDILIRNNILSAQEDVHELNLEEYFDDIELLCVLNINFLSAKRNIWIMLTTG